MFDYPCCIAYQHHKSDRNVGRNVASFDTHAANCASIEFYDFRRCDVFDPVQNELILLFVYVRMTLILV